MKGVYSAIEVIFIFKTYDNTILCK